MVYNKLINKAIIFAYNKHQGQLDKSGLPYIFHPWFLATQMTDEDSVIVALLHDILEDTDTKVDELITLGLNKELIETLLILTHNKEEDYYEYIKRIANNKLATVVKIADLKHNSDISRLDNVSEKDIVRNEKYRKSIEYLMQSIKDNK